MSNDGVVLAFLVLTPSVSVLVSLHRLEPPVQCESFSVLGGKQLVLKYAVYCSFFACFMVEILCHNEVLFLVC